MKNHFASPAPVPSGDRRQLPRWLRLLLAGGALVLLIVILRSPRSAHWTGTTAVPRLNAPVLRGAHPAAGWAGRFTPHTTAPAATAKEIVAGKLAQFARSRRELAQALARRHQVEMSGDVERFFAAVESGHWEDIEKNFSQINGGDSSAGHSNRRSPDIEHLWPAIIDAYGAAEQVHEWPAQQLLDYWKNTAQQILADPETTGSTTTLKAYSHDTVAAANLLAAHHFTDEAEQAYRLATRLWPENLESASGLAGLLARSGRVAEARQVLTDFAQRNPDQQEAAEKASATTRLVGPAPKPGP